jgi:hypothetical protein
MTNLFQRSRHVLAHPPVETPEQAATVDVQRMKAMAAELDAALDAVPGWERRDPERASFVSAGHTDGNTTIVGNTLGNWWLVQDDRQRLKKVASARDALAATRPAPTTKPAPKVSLTRGKS